VIVNVARGVKNDVYSWIFIENLCNNGWIILTAGEDLDRVLFMILAFRIYVKADNLCTTSEALFPHSSEPPPSTPISSMTGDVLRNLEKCLS